MTASPDPHVGLPSEEEIARAIAPLAWAECDAAGVDDKSLGKGATIGALSARASSLIKAASVSALIRPAFDAERGAKIEAMQYAQDTAWQNGKLETRALSAEAKLAQAVEALEGSQKAIREMRTQGAPTAYWDDIETANLAVIATASAAARGETR